MKIKEFLEQNGFFQHPQGGYVKPFKNGYYRLFLEDELYFTENGFNELSSSYANRIIIANLKYFKDIKGIINLLNLE